jgi:hypothetical protein
MAYLSERLREVKRYGLAVPVRYTCEPPGLIGDWPPFLAGFLTAEAHFGLVRDGHRIRPRMRVNVRADDGSLLAEFASRTGVGRLYSYGRKPYEAARMASWVVFSAADLHLLADVLDSCPPRGRKLSEYEIWREAVLLMRPGRPADQVKLHHFADQLRRARAYPSQS